MMVSKTAKKQSNEPTNKLIGSLINNSSDVLIIDDLNFNFNSLFSKVSPKEIDNSYKSVAKTRKKNSTYCTIKFSKEGVQ